MLHQIVVVDDGSTDRTVDVVVLFMAKENSPVKLLSLGTNRGKGGAVKCGVTRSSGRYILMVLLHICDSLHNILYM